MIARLLAMLVAVIPLAGHSAPVKDADVLAVMKLSEGYRLVPYADGPRGTYSVGVGHNLTAHREPVLARYTEPEVLALFAKDLANARRICRKGVEDFDGLPEAVQLVALHVAWSCGPTGFMRFKDLRRSLSYRAYNAAAVSLRQSKWARQVSAARANHLISVLASY